MNTTLGAGTVLSLSMAATVAFAGGDVRLITHAQVMAGNITPDDAPGYPATLSRRGSYRLASNLRVADANTHAVHITSAYVTLDMNGFTIQGPATPGSGAGVFALFEGGVHAAANITITNGSIRGMGNYGVIVGPGSNLIGLRLEHNQGGGAQLTVGPGGGEISRNIVVDNIGHGLFLDSSNCLVSDNAVAMNTGIGIYAAYGAVVRGNRVQSNRSYGIEALGGSTVTANTITNNSGVGLRAVLGTVGYRENVLTGNNLFDGSVEVEGAIQMGTNLCGTDTACP